jgi:hypothetical protein
LRLERREELTALLLPAVDVRRKDTSSELSEILPASTLSALPEPRVRRKSYSKGAYQWPRPNVASRHGK